MSPGQLNEFPGEQVHGARGVDRRTAVDHDRVVSRRGGQEKVPPVIHDETGPRAFGIAPAVGPELRKARDYLRLELDEVDGHAVLERRAKGVTGAETDH